MTEPEQVAAVAEEAARLLRDMLDALARGELTAPAPMVSHLAGSLAALEALTDASRPPF